MGTPPSCELALVCGPPSEAEASGCWTQSAPHAHPCPAQPLLLRCLDYSKATEADCSLPGNTQRPPVCVPGKVPKLGRALYAVRYSLSSGQAGPPSTHRWATQPPATKPFPRLCLCPVHPPPFTISFTCQFARPFLQEAPLAAPRGLFVPWPPSGPRPHPLGEVCPGRRKCECW